jgi:hypothetical protein
MILPKLSLSASHITFSDIKFAIEADDWERTTALFYKMYQLGDIRKLAKWLLLIGSEYLDRSLGHSVSCTAFILLEILERKDQDPWPGLVTLSDYFCKGEFSITPKLRTYGGTKKQNEHMLKAVSGHGIVNLHHTITRYAIERVRHLLSHEEYVHMLNSWISFMGDKK